MLREIVESVLLEKFINLFNADKDKEKYKDIVWDLLQKSYAPLGGIKGSGFESPDAMVKKIKLWKLYLKNGKIVAGILYKDKNYRKAVAVFTDGSKEGKEALKQMLKDDLSRSVIEVSHSLKKFLEKNLPSFVNKYKIPCKYAQKLLPNDEIECDKDGYQYYRDIGGEKIKKLMLGIPQKFTK